MTYLKICSYSFCQISFVHNQQVTLCDPWASLARNFVTSFVREHHAELRENNYVSYIIMGGSHSL